MKKTERRDPIHPVSIKFARVYKITPFTSELILQDIYFYTDLFLKSTINKRAPWERVRTYLFTRYGVWLHLKAVKRWYQRVKDIRSVPSDY